MTVYRERLPLHPLLGRHDSRSRAYAVAPTATTLVATRHAAYIGILDQGQLGSCTGNAGVGAVYRDPFLVAPGRWAVYGPDEAGAVALYSDATRIDGASGTYPPTDTGSDGLSVAKALKAAGIIAGYLHAFSLSSALLQLMSTPLITGISWYNSMFNPGPDGVLTLDRTSGLAGGHEAEQGDVTAFVPAYQPGPNPTPVPHDQEDVALWTATRHWTTLQHIGTNEAAARAVKIWAAAKGLA